MQYFLLGTLESFFSENPDEKRVKLSSVDKIVMILEVATDLKDLHRNDKYHGNLSSQFIYIKLSSNILKLTNFKNKFKPVIDMKYIISIFKDGNLIWVLEKMVNMNVF